VTVSVLWSRRQASYPATEDASQRGTVLVVDYTLLQGW
jgi:hypothetical protein